MACASSKFARAWLRHRFAGQQTELREVTTRATATTDSLGARTARGASRAFCCTRARPIVDLASQLGHSPTMTLNTYGHVIRELREAPRLSATEQIQLARERFRGSAP
jgi:hypothetical protein